MISFQRTGALVIGGLETARQGFVDNLQALGIDYISLSPVELKQRFPALDTASFGPPSLPDSEAFWRPGGEPLAGFCYADAGYIDDPQLAARNLCASAAVLGAQFRYGEHVTDVLKHDGRVAGVRLATATSVLAPIVVNAAGPASDQLTCSLV